MFCVAPRGNGMDCLRYWECLYLKTIPIVCGFNWFNDLKLPVIRLNDWSEFKSDRFTKGLYDNTWADFDVSSLHLDRFSAATIN